MRYRGVEIWMENGKYRLLDPKDGKVRIFSDKKYIKRYIDSRIITSFM